MPPVFFGFSLLFASANSQCALPRFCLPTRPIVCLLGLDSFACFMLAPPAGIFSSVSSSFHRSFVFHKKDIGHSPSQVLPCSIARLTALHLLFTCLTVLLLTLRNLFLQVCPSRPHILTNLSHAFLPALAVRPPRPAHPPRQSSIQIPRLYPILRLGSALRFCRTIPVLLTSCSISHWSCLLDFPRRFPYRCLYDGHPLHARDLR